MPNVTVGVTEKAYRWLGRKADELNEKRKKGDPEVRISDVAGPIFNDALEVRMDGK
jgi:hypothetical protein